MYQPNKMVCSKEIESQSPIFYVRAIDFVWLTTRTFGSSTSLHDKCFDFDLTILLKYLDWQNLGKRRGKNTNIFSNKRCIIPIDNRVFTGIPKYYFNKYSIGVSFVFYLFIRGTIDIKIFVHFFHVVFRFFFLKTRSSVISCN